MTSLRRSKLELLAKNLGEFGLIERILSRFSTFKADRVSVGPGDDAAVLELDEKSRVLLTTDMLVEDVHFRLAWSYPEALGFKSVAANLSDVAAMGGRDLGIVVSLGIPAAMPVKAIDRLYLGMSRALSLFGGNLLGGDTVRSNRIIVSISAMGVLIGERPLLRSGAVAGDKLCVTGDLGRSEAGLLLLKKYFREKRRGRRVELEAWAERTGSYFKKKLPPSLKEAGYSCIMRHLMPSPRVKEVRVLSVFGPSSMIDISDGLSADLMHVSRASCVGAILVEKNLPIDRKARVVAQSLGASEYKMALSSGEEYELLFTLPEPKVRHAASVLARRCGTDMEVIGEITGDPAHAYVIGGRGRKKILREKGYKHF